MTYAKVILGVVVTYPYSFAQMRADNPTVSFCWPLDSLSLERAAAVIVADVAQPAYNADTQTCEEQTPEYVSGVWRQKWNVRAATPQELQDRIPRAVDPHQFVLALLDGGYLAGVQAAIDALPAAAKQRAQIKFDRAIIFRRGDAFVDQIRTFLGLTQAQMDAVFVAASKL